MKIVKITENERREMGRRLIEGAYLLDAPRVPGAWWKKYGHKFPNISELRAKHLPHQFKSILYT